MKQNITISLDRELISTSARCCGAAGNLCQQVLAAELARTVEEANADEQARLQALAALDMGFHMGGQPLPSRDELHER